MSQILSRDGTVISYTKQGTGPRLLLVHGSLMSSFYYRRLARILERFFTVYVMDRRGRGDSGPQGEEYGLQKECEDVMALLKDQDISLLFGHSYGGLIAINVVRQYPIIKLALYEPAINLEKEEVGNWVKMVEQALAEDNEVDASIAMVRGLNVLGVAANLPTSFFRPIFWAMLKTVDWKRRVPLMVALPAEERAIVKEYGVKRYSHVEIPVLILQGERTEPYFRKAAASLAETLPVANHSVLPGCDHLTPTTGRCVEIAEHLQKFFQ